MHNFAAISSPQLFSSKDEFFPLNTTNINDSIDVDITLSQLVPLHRFIHVNGSFISRNMEQSNVPVTINTKISYLYNFTVIQNEKKDTIDTQLVFNSYSNESTSFEILNKEVVGFDSIQLKLTVKSNYENVAGFKFHWSFNNPSAVKYSKTAKFIMSILLGYMLLVFCFYLKFDSDRFTQIFCIIFGIAGVLAPNPFSYILGYDSTYILDVALGAIFVALYRMFILSQLQLIRINSQRINQGFMVFSSIFFILYGLTDTIASYQRAELVSSSKYIVNEILQSEKVSFVFNIIYILISIIFLVSAYFNSEIISRKFFFFACVVFVSCMATVVAQILLLFVPEAMFSVAPQLFLYANYMTCASFSLYFLHPGGSLEYHQVGAKDDQQLILDVQNLSAGDSSDSDFNDEEEEEEE